MLASAHPEKSSLGEIVKKLGGKGDGLRILSAMDWLTTWKWIG